MSKPIPTTYQELCDCLKRYIGKLDTIWTEVGIDKKQQEDRFSTVCYHLQNLIVTMVEEEESMKAKLMENVEKFGEELVTLHNEMALPPFTPETMSLLQLEKVLRSKLTTVKKEKAERMKILKNLRSEDQDLCDRICATPYYIQTGVVPSKAQLEALEAHITSLTAEKSRRFGEFTAIKSNIVCILKDLEKDPDTSFEREVVCEEDESFILSPENIASLKDLEKELEREQREIISRVSSLKEQMETLWERLVIPKEETQAFLQNNQGYKHSVAIKMMAEIERCEILKLENMQRFVDRVRKEMVTWWDKCFFGVQQREEFLHYKDDNYTEELLERHDQEVIRLKAYYETQKDILDRLTKREQLFKEMIEFEKKASDPNRLFHDRGGSMLREEKARKKLLKELPMVEQKTRDTIVNWEIENGKDFLVNGLKFNEYVDRQWENYKEEMSRDKEQRQKDRAKGDTTNTPVKRRYMGTPTKTPNKHRKLNETGQKTPGTPLRKTTPRRLLTSTMLAACRPPRPSPSKTSRSRRSTRLARKALGEINETNKMGQSTLFSHTTVSSAADEDPSDLTTTGSYQDFAMGLNNTSRPHCRSSVLVPNHPRV